MAITNVDFLSTKNFDQNLRKEKASILLLACNSYYMCSRKIVICNKNVKQYAFLRQAKARQISKKRNNDKMTVNTILQHSPNGQHSMKIQFLSLTTLIQPLYNLYNFVARTTSLYHTLVFIAITPILPVFLNNPQNYCICLSHFVMYTKTHICSKLLIKEKTTSPSITHH
jgi:hypothetical protein